MRDVMVAYWAGNFQDRVVVRFWRDNENEKCRTTRYANPTAASMYRLGRVLKGMRPDTSMSDTVVFLRYFDIGRAA